MRVTQQMMSNDILTALSNTYMNLDQIGNQLSTGKSLSKPSDNPGGVTYSVDLQASMTYNTQYQQTSQSALGWVQSSNAALQQLNDVMLRIRTLTVQASNDTNTASDRQAIASEVSQLQQQVVKIANTQYGNQYIFGGSLTQSKPFNSNGGYSGNTNAVTHQIAPSTVLQTNVDPTKLFNGANGVYNTLSQLLQHLQTGGNPAAAQNTGTEQVALSGLYTGVAPANYLLRVPAYTAQTNVGNAGNESIAISGTYTGAGNPPAMLVKANALDAFNNVASVVTSTNGGITWSAAIASTNIPTGANTPTNFNLGNGLTATWTQATTGAASVVINGDKFTIIPSNSVGIGAPTTYSAFPTGVINGTNTLAITGAYTGSGAPPTIQVQTTALTSSNVTGIKISTDGGTTWSGTITATSTLGSAGTPTQFNVGNGLTLTWTQANGALVTTGDTYNLFTSNVSALGANVGNEAVAFSGTYTGSGTPPTILTKATQLDGNNNVVGIEISTDNGKNWGAQVTATQYSGPTLAIGTQTTFTLGNGMTATWNQATNSGASSVVTASPAHNDQFVFTPPKPSYNQMISSTDGGNTWLATNIATIVTSSSTQHQFNLGNGIVGSLTYGAVDPSFGDQFAFSTGAANSDASTYTMAAGPNMGNEQITISGSYSGTGTPNIQFRASQTDAFNNVTGVQMSMDGGVTWGSTITDSNTAAPTAANTVTTFNLNNGLTLTWNQATANGASVYTATHSDSFSYTPQAAQLTNDLGGIDAVMSTVTSMESQMGAQQNTIQSNVTFFQNQAVIVQKTLSQLEDADFTKLSTEFATAQMLYQAALQVDAKSIQPSLVQFLK